MALELNWINKAITENKNGKTLMMAKAHQDRLKFHVIRRTTSFTPYACLQATQFLNWAENLLPHDKFRLFKEMFRYPVKTNEVTGVCFDKLSRVFDGRNPVFQYRFVDSKYAADWREYQLNVLNEPGVWQTKGWEYLKTEINSVLVVDIPTEQTTDFPEPYFYWLTIDRIIAYDADSDTGVMKWIVFRDKDHIVVIDDETYRVFEDKHNTGRVEGAPIVENAHGLGYCPARFFWNESIDMVNQPDVKASPLTGQLESLDWFLFFHISKCQLDLHGAYPIFSGYEQACDFSNAENGDYCDGGFLKDKEGHYKIDAAGILERCPKCGNKRLVGPGSFVEIPVPNADENQPDLRNPVQMLTVDKDALDYNTGEEQRLRSDIITNVVGQEEVITAREALNEQQVQANFENQSTILNRIKKGFEAAQQWVDDTICRLRYGEYYVSGYVNYGTDFYLSTAAELRAGYKSLKDNGASEAELDAMQQKIIQTEYRNDPTAQQRMSILAELEPYAHLTREELTDLQGKGLIDANELRIKLNFSNFVKRFERENTNVVEFGNAIPYDTKIATIKAELLKYATEQVVPTAKVE